MKRQIANRMKVSGTTDRPRLAVFRSLKHMYAQLIDDQKGITLVSAHDFEIKEGKKAQKAFKVGEMIGKKAIAQGVKAIVFDRGGRAYHGRVKAVADGARASGLVF